MFSNLIPQVDVTAKVSKGSLFCPPLFLAYLINLSKNTKEKNFLANTISLLKSRGI